MLKNIKALKSTLLGVVFAIGLGLGVATDKLSNEFMLAIVPCIYLVISDVFKEKKEDE